MTINCKGRLIDLSTPKVMGILNVTPDSFFSESRTRSEEKILQTVERMLKEGATFIDIGGYSSRPGATDVGTGEELQRVIPAIELILKHHPDTLLSVDTFRSEVASAGIQAGAALINDIAAGSLDEKMMQVVAEFQVPYIMMHMKGTPQNMQEFTVYKDLAQEVIYYFSEKVAEARTYGINDLIIDPGFGFSKNIAQNFELLNKIDLFQTLELPILAGLSRKSTIYKTLNCTPAEALNGTTVLNTVALQKGVGILRVHDVKEAMEAVELVSHLKN